MNLTSISNGTNLLTAITLMLYNINALVTNTNNGILPPPNIDFMNETMVRASLSVKEALSSNETIPLGYKFVIHVIKIVLILYI